MSAFASPVSFVASAAPMPPSSPPPCTGNDANADGFARCLEQARENDANAADDAAQRPAAKKPTANAKTDRGAREAGTARAVERSDAPPKTKQGVDAEGEVATDTAAETATDPAAAPDLAALLPGWAAPPAAVPAAAPAAMTTANDSGLLQAGPAVGGVKLLSPTPPRDEQAVRALAQGAAAATVAAEVNAASTALPSSSALLSATSEQRDVTLDPTSAPLTLPSAPVAASTTSSPVAAPKGADAPPVTATLPAPIDSPAFAPSLATQVRWWASDGVQQAQLLLNPAEMGPVMVKIMVIDGREARIDFSADLATTRSAIESALPVLAAALDDGGLKLTGGGVHDGSAQHQPAWHAHGVTHRTAARARARGDDLAVTAATGRNAAGRGMVDLVA